MSSGPSRLRVILLVAIHAGAGLILATSGLFLSRTSYQGLWVAWVISGAITGATRRTRYATHRLLAGDLSILTAAFLILPGSPFG